MNSRTASMRDGDLARRYQLAIIALTVSGVLHAATFATAGYLVVQGWPNDRARPVCLPSQIVHEVSPKLPALRYGQAAPRIRTAYRP